MRRARVDLWITRGVWVFYFLAVLVGVRSRYLAMGLLPISIVFWLFSPNRATFLEEVVTVSDRFEKSKRLLFAVRGIAVLAMFAVPVASWFFYHALTQDVWDWGAYIQATYTGAFQGTPIITGNDVRIDAREFHPTIMIPILTGLYRIFPFESWLVMWHGFFLVIPVFVFVRGLREAYAESGLSRDAYVETLAIFAFLFSPVISGNMQWPYHFHISGILFFALAFYAYSQGKLGWCLLSLSVFSAHKEEFALFSGAFALPILLDTRFSIKKRLIYGLIIFFGGVALYQWGSSQANSSFRDRFGNLGDSPKEALIHLVIDPLRYFKAWSSTSSLKFMSFFFICSFWFLAKTRKVFLLLLPCLPFLFLYGASDFWNMREFRHHYALPLFIGFFSVLIFGVLPSLLKSRPHAYVGRVFFLALIALSAFWAQDTPFRSLTTAIREYGEHHADQEFLSTLRENPNEVICCESRLCTFLTARPLYVLAEQCLKGSKLIADASPARVGLLIHNRTALKNSETQEPVDGRIRIPKIWEYSSDYMTFSWVTPEKIKTRSVPVR